MKILAALKSFFTPDHEEEIWFLRQREITLTKDCVIYIEENEQLVSRLTAKTELVGLLRHEIAVKDREITALLRDLEETNRRYDSVVEAARQFEEENAALVRDLAAAHASAVQTAIPGGVPEQPEPEDREVFDGTAEAAFDIVRLSFRESNKWCLSRGEVEIWADILDAEFIERVDRRDVVFGHGDVVRCLLRTISRKRGAEPIRSEYHIVKVLELIPPSDDQLKLVAAGGAR